MHEPVVRVHRPRKPIFLAVAAALALLPIAASNAGAGTIYCSVASKPAEFAICNSENLQVLDGQIDHLYKSHYATAASILTQTGLMRDQHAWLSQRNDCRADLGCLERYYKARLSQLAAFGKPAREPIAQFTRFGNQKSER